MAKEIRTTEEVFGEVDTKPFKGIGIAEVRAPITTENPFGYIVPAPEPTFGQKWNKYLFSAGDEGRWTKPDRYEKFYNVTKWPVETGLKMLGSLIRRANKFVTAVSPAPEVMKTTATLNPNALKDIFPSISGSFRKTIAL